MFTIFIRAIFLYMLTVLFMRGMGKRQLGELQPFELVITLMIADLAVIPLGDLGISLLYGVLPMLALLAMHNLITLLSMRFERFRALVCGTPSVVIKRGKIQIEELRRLCFDLSDLMESLRAQGIFNPAEVGSAILETNGTLSVQAHSANRPATPGDLQIDPGYEGIPLTLIMDGRTQQQNLSLGGLDQTWLDAQLASLGYVGAKEVFLCSLDTQGKLFVHGKSPACRVDVIQALDPAAVGW